MVNAEVDTAVPDVGTANAGTADVGRPGVGAERIAAHVALVESVLSRQLDDLQDAWAQSGSDGCAVPEADLPAQVRELLQRGGKRTRPVMVLLGWLAAPDGPGREGHEDMVRAAAALEMLHCFALVHDDLIDESPTRRGRATVHERASTLHRRRGGSGDSAHFGDSIAVLVGDLAHSEAERLAAPLPPAMRRLWQQLVVELLAGQVADVVGSTTADRRVEFALLVARQKTGLYTVARPLQLGAMAAGADGATLAALEAYEPHAGEAFALRDEVLGAFGDPRVTGKPSGDDIRSGKPTVLLALAARSLRGRAAAALQRAGTSAMSDDDVRTVQDALVEHGVLAVVETMIDDRTRDAVAALDPSVLSGAGVTELTRVVDDLARRGR